MLRSAAALARARYSPRAVDTGRPRVSERDAPRPLEAGLPRTLAALVILPTVGVAAGMHYNPEFRAMVEERVPGATNALAKITGASYATETAASEGDQGTKSTLPKDYEKIPDILKRIETQAAEKDESSAPAREIAAGDKAAEPERDLVASLKDKVAAGATEAEANAAKLSLKLEKAWKTASESTKTAGESGTESAENVAEKFTSEARAAAAKIAKPQQTAPEPFDAKPASEASASAAVEEDAKASPSPSEPTQSTGAGAAAVTDIAPSATPAASSQKTVSAPPSSGTPIVKLASDSPSSSTASASGADSGDRSSGADKFARLFGRGDFDPASVKGKDVVDPSVYRKPAFMLARESGEQQVTRQRSTSGASSVPSQSPEVEALEAELKSQAKWDAVRLQEAVRAQSVADKKQAAAEVAALSKKHKVELGKVKEEAMLDAQKLMEQKTREVEARMEKRRDAEVSKLLKEREQSLRASIESDFLERERLASEARRQELADMRAAVEALHDDLDKSREHRKASQRASAIAASAFSLKDALQGNGPFAKELALASQTSELGMLVAASIPDGVASRGVPTVEDLKSSFVMVSREGRKAALVPDDAVGTLWGHFLAAVVSRVKVAVDYGGSFGEPQTNEDRIRYAEKCVGQGDLKSAVKSLEGLSGLASEITKDWMADANARIAADLGAQVLLADAIVTQQALSNVVVKS